jgi:hypothetical protein
MFIPCAAYAQEAKPVGQVEVAHGRAALGECALPVALPGTRKAMFLLEISRRRR